MKTVDLVIVGAGPIGLACGIEAQKKGLEYVIIDKGPLVNSLYNYPLGMTFFSTSDKLEIGGVPFISHNHKPTRSEALEYYRRVAQSWKLNTRLYESVKSVEKREDDLFYVKTSKSSFVASKVILATGFYDIPHQVGIPGEHLPKVAHYYREAHPYYGQKLAIIGAMNSAVDAALECYRKGADVTMIVRGSEIGERVKYWVKPDVENRIKEGSIRAIFNSSVSEIREESIVVQTPDGTTELPNDFVLALTGYEPNYQFLRAMGIDIADDEKRKPVYNPDSMETNVPGLYLAGVICGGMETNKWFIENSRVHADVIIDHITAAE
ncbi:YpdA family putative bacillithiol disulfide reductase [Phaeocystidibacter luteus]|uniref:YpdA family putative bacillithiol disulfide reductase n=1 Tax=Phaeocystidibacter luteus TaxID=911197 RepID=A0A6N6RG43_9FLAO|nr:YpdA family putative bacillithiol disulfide reductase [Phaeocystidibacter luteus]KAB2808032.1 YpdA family putative bacillithiol disulfide reductase [Phaeocystidibacter luteus]